MPLRVVSYNIHSQRDDAAALVAVARSTAPDVMIVQEGPRRLRWRQRSGGARRVVRAGGGGRWTAGIGKPAVDQPPGPGHRHPVPAVSAHSGPAPARRRVRRLPVGRDARFTVAGSHLSTDPAERPAQAERFARELTGAPAPVIVGADLNEEADGPAWAVVAAGRTDAAVAADRADRPTFPRGPLHRRIDALFVDPRITVVHYDVVDTPQTRLASDHLPILADLLLPGPD
ncbi:endonuclease [Salinispora arenicola]|uniref:endonuclease/exonuclease/phosphatase family protein n=1 Tax=Salinispora arenicola TaxID=168697 RepID=UPI001430A57C|nr:endonuclease/exonuclease/phosphatase family protein [Salinispora arenicola]NIL40387.1 endonuclease [Salinispora arenicola]